MNLGCIKPLCDLLTVMDSKIVQVALNGLENILRLGEQEAKQENNGTGVNPYCSLIEEAYGMLQEMHTNMHAEKTFDLDLMQFTYNTALLEPFQCHRQR